MGFRSCSSKYLIASFTGLAILGAHAVFALGNDKITAPAPLIPKANSQKERLNSAASLLEGINTVTNAGKQHIKRLLSEYNLSQLAGAVFPIEIGRSEEFVPANSSAQDDENAKDSLLSTLQAPADKSIENLIRMLNLYGLRRLASEIRLRSLAGR